MESKNSDDNRDQETLEDCCKEEERAELGHQNYFLFECFPSHIVQFLLSYQPVFSDCLGHSYDCCGCRHCLDQGGNPVSSAYHSKYLETQLERRVQETLGENKLESKNLDILPMVDNTADLDQDEQNRKDKNTDKTETKSYKNISGLKPWRKEH